MELSQKALNLCKAVEALPDSPEKSRIGSIAGHLYYSARYVELSEVAKDCGYSMPETPGAHSHGERVWVSYWEGCIAHAQNPDAGRPIIPHRSGG